MNKQLKGTASILLATVIWGSTFVAQEIGTQYMGAFTFLAMRGILAVPALLLVLLFSTRKEFRKILTNKRLWIAGIPCGVALFAATAMQQIGLNYTTPGKSGFITTMYIILVPILGLFLKQKPQKTIWISVAMATIGLYLISGAGFTAINIGDALMLGCAVAFAVQIQIMDHVAGNLNSIALNMAQALVCAILAGICALCFEDLHLQNIISCWLPLCYAGVLSMGFAYTLQIVGQKSLPVTPASLLMSLESVFAGLSGVLATQWGWLQEDPMTWVEITGCALVFCAVILSQLPLNGKKKAP